MSLFSDRTAWLAVERPSPCSVILLWAGLPPASDISPASGLVTLVLGVAAEAGIRFAPISVAALGIGSRCGVHSRRSSSASFKIWRACWPCSNGARESPGTTGVSSRRFSSRRPWRANRICFSARSIVAAKCKS